MTDSEKKKTAGEEVEEKKIKSGVLRRRKAPAAPEVIVKAEVAAPKEAEEAEAKAPRKKAGKAAAEKPGKKAKKEGKAPVKKGAQKEAAKEEAPFVSVEEAVEAAPEKKAEEGIKKEVVAAVPVVIAPPSRREVKIFGKEAKAEKLFYTKQLFRKGKRYEVKGPRHKPHAPTAARPFKKSEITVTKAEKRVIRVVDAISVADFSQRLGVKSGEIIRKLMALGVMATVNQFIDADAAATVANEYGYGVENVAENEEALLSAGIEEVLAGELKPRAPVVTVMGHVDHGKTSLLDAIRRTNVASAEAGGITQHIGAYHVHLDKGDITFLDTPGHEAFTAMRARGAKVTDIVVLVVAADDGVMPQTVEAINHAKAAGVPIIVAINKMDLPQADPKRVKQALTEYGLVPEDWGGDAIFVEVSAKKGIHIKELLELILLQAEILELKASPSTPASGVIIEAKLDKGRGPVATVLIQSGTLKVGDACIAGIYAGRVRAMTSDWGKRIEEAFPAMPVEIFGLSGVPQAGDIFSVVKEEATAKHVAAMRQGKLQQSERAKSAKVSLQDLYAKILKGEVRELSVIVKADVQGSIEAVKESLNKLSSDKVSLKVIHSATGGINEGDVMLAAASNAIVIGFNVRPEQKADELAKSEGVDIRLYTIIYNLVDDVKNAMQGLLAPIVKEEVVGRAEIREVYRISKVGNIAGCHVTNGKIPRSARVRLIRDSVVVYEGKISSLKRFKEDVREVASGYECGLTIEGYSDIKAGDVIEAYELREEAARL